MAILTTDPRTGVTTSTGLEPTPADEVRRITGLAAQASPDLARRGRVFRAELLRAAARSIENQRARLVAVADAESGLGTPRLHAEISRSAFQFALFAEAIEEGGYLEAAVDHAAQTPLGPQPDIRRMLVPLGPVAVFGASNFPFAFSVLGGDVASALAAGCAVIAKAHGSHPLTSALSYGVLLDAVRAVGAPEGTVGIVFGQTAGTALVQDAAVTAVGFTGSLGAAEALQAAIAKRPAPIPFFGELSSVNPLLVTPAATAARADEIAEGVFESYTGSGGQLCTKPGIAFVPTGEAGDRLVDVLGALTAQAPAPVLLNSRIATAFTEIKERLVDAGAAPLTTGTPASGEGFTVRPMLLLTEATAVDADVAEECFGPLMVVARYTDVMDVLTALERIPRSLTVTVQAEEVDVPLVAELSTKLEALAGRLVFNGYPTGVRVSWAQTHGGPWPATNTQHTSVGVSAIRRWLRPVSWQNAPQGALPSELRDGPAVVPTRLDGVLTLPAR